MRRKNTCQDPLTSKSARTLLSYCGDWVAVGSFRPHPQLAKRPMRSWVSTPLPNGDPRFLRKHDSKIAPFGIEVTLVDGHVAHQFRLAEPPLEHFSNFKQHRAEYYDRLMAVRTDGHWEQWIKFFLRGVSEVSLDATATARKILLLREASRTRLSEGGSTSNLDS